MKVWDFMKEFTNALEKQLADDDARWGDTWLKRTRQGQEERTITEFNNYFDKYLNAGVPIPWLKIIGNAMICWIREQHPEIWKE
jgi:hypothetical protein